MSAGNHRSLLESLETRRLCAAVGVPTAPTSITATAPFTSVTRYSTERTAAAGLASADFNRDGKIDIAVVNAESVSSGSISVFMNKGDGTFNAAQVRQNEGFDPSSIVAVDLNHDKIPDLAYADDIEVGILINKGDGTFYDAITVGFRGVSQSITYGDFNGDSLYDLAVTNEGQNTVSVVLNRGRNHFYSSYTVDVGVAPTGIVAGDFTGDGRTDLAVSELGSTFDTVTPTPGVQLLTGNGKGRFNVGALIAIDGLPHGIAAGDLNRDRKLDLVTANGGLAGGTSVGDAQQSVTVLLGNGDGTFVKKPDIAEPSNLPHGVTIANITRDHRPDILATAGSSLSFFKTNDSGGAGYLGSQLGAADATEVIASDFNGDGLADFAFTASGDSLVVVLR